jgi:hypothetical protein
MSLDNHVLSFLNYPFTENKTQLRNSIRVQKSLTSHVDAEPAMEYERAVARAVWVGLILPGAA